MNVPFLTDPGGAEGLFRWREAPAGKWTCDVEPGSCQVNGAIHSDPDV